MAPRRPARRGGVVTARLTGSPEACTRLGATEAGWRLAALNPDSPVLVLQHSGAEGNRWQLRAACLEHGTAVAAFKQARAVVVHGAVAVWNGGRVSRFETAADFVQASARR